MTFTAAFREAYRRAVDKLATGECMATPVPGSSDVLSIMRTLTDRELTRAMIKTLGRRYGVLLADSE